MRLRKDTARILDEDRGGLPRTTYIEKLIVNARKKKQQEKSS